MKKYVVTKQAIASVVSHRCCEAQLGHIVPAAHFVSQPLRLQIEEDLAARLA